MYRKGLYMWVHLYMIRKPGSFVGSWGIEGNVEACLGHSACLVGKRLHFFGSLVTVEFRVISMQMPWLGMDQAVHSSVPDQQFQPHHVLAGSRLRSSWRGGTLNIGLPHQVWGSRSPSLEVLLINSLGT
jgi:hypothetical protein